jgi:hypothetical protein
MIVAYTIGHTDSYNKALVEHPDECFKLGETKDYQGGWIWKTSKEAAAFIYSQAFLDVDWGDGQKRDPKKFSVYKVTLANGWSDVTPVPGKDGIFHLKIDSKFSK